MDTVTEFLDCFGGLDDPRMSGKLLHPASEILLVTLCGVIGGAQGWEDIEVFGLAKQDVLGGLLPFEHARYSQR